MCWEVIKGMKEIGKRFGYNRQTIANWEKKHGFPLSWLPDGSRAVSTDMINEWLHARRDVMQERRRLKAIETFKPRPAQRDVA